MKSAKNLLQNILLYFTDYDYLWKTCDDGLNRTINIDEGNSTFDLPTPENLRPHEIPRTLFEPIFKTQSCANHTRCLNISSAF